MRTDAIMQQHSGWTILHTVVDHTCIFSVAHSALGGVHAKGGHQIIHLGHDGGGKLLQGGVQLLHVRACVCGCVCGCVCVAYLHACVCKCVTVRLLSRRDPLTAL